MPDGAVVRRMLYEPRPLQRTIHESLKRFSCLVCHRGFGKTVLAVNQLVSSALRASTPGQKYTYIAPLRNQAKNVAWDLLLKYSEPFWAEAPNIAELRVDLITGSRIQLFGADNPDAMRGIHPSGTVLDEYGDMTPSTWNLVVLPSLQNNRGWAMFIGTPKGQNNFYDIYNQAITDPEWYGAMFKASETGVFDQSALNAARRSMTPEEYAQEFECSFQAPNVGAYYGKEMGRLDDGKQITRVPWEPTVPVTTAWDLGIDDATAIWFCQQVGREVRIIDYYENSGEGLAHYAAQLKARPYVYGEHLLPHDAQVKELGTGRSRVEVLQSLGIQATVVPAQRVEDGINAVRMLLPRCWFDAEKCARGIKALRQYQREWVDKLGTWRSTPLHDWSSHGADGFRYLAMGLKPPANKKPLDYSAFNKRIV
jgi:phage terminase large subunit